MDGCMFEFFIDAQPQKGLLTSKRLYKNTIFTFKLYVKRLKQNNHKFVQCL